MFNRLFPRQIDNAYRGYWPALWLLVPIVAFKLLIGFNVSGLNPLVAPADIAQNADGIPLSTLGAQGASLVLFLFSSWGLATFVLCLIGVVVLIRYRAMIPLLYLALLIEQAGRTELALAHPIVRSGAQRMIGGIHISTLINDAFLVALAIGFVLSLLGRSRTEED